MEKPSPIPHLPSSPFPAVRCLGDERSEWRAGEPLPSWVHVTHPLAFTLWSFPISSFLRINKIQIEKREDTKCSYSCLQSVFMRMLYGWVGSSLIPTSWPNKPTILSIPAAGKRLSANVDVRENEERGRNCWLFLRLLSSSFHFFSVSWTQVMDRREKIHSLPSLYVVIPLSLPDLSFIPVLVTLLPCL